MAAEHRKRLVELPRLPVEAALPAGLEAVGAPAELGDVDRGGGVMVDPHDAAQVADLRAHCGGVGDVGVQGHPVEERLHVTGPVDAVEEVAGGDVGRDLEGATEEAPEDHLGAVIGTVDGATRDA